MVLGFLAYTWGVSQNLPVRILCQNWRLQCKEAECVRDQEAPGTVEGLGFKCVSKATFQGAGFVIFIPNCSVAAACRNSVGRYGSFPR